MTALNDNQKQELQKQQSEIQKSFFLSPEIKTKFEAVLQTRTDQFLTSLLQVVNGNDALKSCNPMSIFSAAMVAATLDLPINQNLGFAWLVPYKGSAQFQIGYKGFIQLAQRSGQYARITTAPVYKNQFKSWNPITEDLQVDNTVPGEGDVAGYFAFFRLLNGYEKVEYWPKEKVLNHAKRFSKSYDSNGSIWKSDFDKMAMKTVLKSLLSTWGPMSIQMEKAVQVDQGVIRDEHGQDVFFPDNEGPTREERANKALDATAEALKGVVQRSTGAGN